MVGKHKMFSSRLDYTKLKTNLRLAINRLKLLEKKKVELTQKSRKEIADYISMGKSDRARIRVEHIIREDYMVEAMEMLEMYCDLLLARFGLIQQMKDVDAGLEEAIASVVWAAHRLLADVPEMKPIFDQFLLKYGKEYPAKSIKHVNQKFQHRLGVQAPPKILVEQYLIEIAKNYNVPFEPDARVMKEAEAGDLLDLSDATTNNLGGGGGGSFDPPGFRGYPAPPHLPSDPFSYALPQPLGHNIGGFVSPIAGASGTSTAPSLPPNSASYNIPLNDENIPKHISPMMFEQPPSYSSAINSKDSRDANKQAEDKPKPTPRGKLSPTDRKPRNTDLFPELPSVPDDMPDDPAQPFTYISSSVDDIDFDDLNRRFQNLKKGD